MSEETTEEKLKLNRVKTYNITPGKNSQYKLFLEWCTKAKYFYNNLVWLFNELEKENPEVMDRYKDAIIEKTKDGKILRKFNVQKLRPLILSYAVGDKKLIRPHQCKEVYNFEILNNISSNIPDSICRHIDQSYATVLRDRKKGKAAKLHFKRASELVKVSWKIKHGKTAGLGIKNGILYFSQKKDNKIALENIKLDLDKECYRTVQLTPKQGYIQVGICYETDLPEAPKDLKEDVYLGIDLGVTNFASIASSDGKVCSIIRGGPLKSFNKHFNEEVARIQRINALRQNKFDEKYLVVSPRYYTSKKLRRLAMKRNNKMSTFMHQASSYVVNLMIKHKLKTCIIGKNIGWKEDVCMNKTNKKIFLQIPHNLFIEKLRYKLEDRGMVLETVEESYTSQTSALSNEKLINYDNSTDEEKKEFHKTKKGRRTKRGLFVDKKLDLAINADINGALNIIRKKIPSVTYDLEKMSRNIFTPRKILVGEKYTL